MDRWGGAINTKDCNATADSAIKAPACLLHRVQNQTEIIRLLLHLMVQWVRACLMWSLLLGIISKVCFLYPFNRFCWSLKRLEMVSLLVAVWVVFCWRCGSWSCQRWSHGLFINRVLNHCHWCPITHTAHVLVAHQKLVIKGRIRIQWGKKALAGFC